MAQREDSLSGCLGGLCHSLPQKGRVAVVGVPQCFWGSSAIFRSISDCRQGVGGERALGGVEWRRLSKCGRGELPGAELIQAPLSAER